MHEFLQQLINGIALGGVYALIALGYTMVYGIIQLINFAHGEVVMIGAMVAFTVMSWLAANTALPHPPRTSQKVPTNSAPSFFDNGMLYPRLTRGDHGERSPFERVPMSNLGCLALTDEALQRGQKEQRHDDNRA